MSPVQKAEPLPECAVCEAPMRREAHTAQDGICAACREAARREAALQPWYER